MKTTRTLILALAPVALYGTMAIAQPSGADARIEKAARNSYTFKHTMKDDDVKVKSTDGNVVLSGSVADESHKSLAEQTVAALPGVKGVDNRLQVRGTAPAERSDAWITAKVKGALLFHRSVHALGVDVDTKDGFVTLTGKADSQSQQELAGRYAQDVEGVRSVNNQLTVTTGKGKPTRSVVEKIDDASTTAHVKTVLLEHRSTRSAQTQVKTVNGEVTIDGTADDAAQKDLITKTVEDVRGVKSVRNRMTTASPAR